MNKEEPEPLGVWGSRGEQGALLGELVWALGFLGRECWGLVWVERWSRELVLKLPCSITSALYLREWWVYLWWLERGWRAVWGWEGLTPCRLRGEMGMPLVKFYKLQSLEPRARALTQ